MSGRVRGFFAGDAFTPLEVCDIRDFEGTLRNRPDCAVLLQPWTLRRCAPCAGFVERLAAGESLINAVPESDVIFA